MQAVRRAWSKRAKTPLHHVTQGDNARSTWAFFCKILWILLNCTGLIRQASCVNAPPAAATQAGNQPLRCSAVPNSAYRAYGGHLGRCVLTVPRLPDPVCAIDQRACLGPAVATDLLSSAQCGRLLASAMGGGCVFPRG